MQIIHDINDNLFGKLSKEELIKKLQEYWSQSGVTPSRIEFISEELVCVTFDEEKITEKTNGKTQYASDLCNKGKFKDAERILLEVTKVVPMDSEAWRLLAQIHMQEKKIDLCINELIAALQADPKNKWALVLMGNILARNLHKKKEAETYFLCVLKYYPDDMIALNNLAGIYLENKEYSTAIPTFQKVIKTEPGYLNAYYGLACCYKYTGNDLEAFNTCREGLLKGQSRKENPGVRDELAKIYVGLAQSLEENINGKAIWEGIADELHEVDGIDIEYQKDSDSMVYAHLSYAYTTGKGKHIVKYDPEKEHIAHLMVHELTHLRMMQLARKEGKDMAFTMSDDNLRAFIKKYKRAFEKNLKKLSVDNIEQFMETVLKGLGLQLMNCPLDLLVEQYIFENYPQLRPIQMLSMFKLEQDNINSANNKQVASAFPQDIIKANRIMNLCTSISFKNMYGLDFTNYHHPTKQEMLQAQDLYDEFCAYKDYKPGEEYELCEYFISSFDMEDFVTMINLTERQRQESLIDSLPDDEEVVAEQKEIAEEANKEFRENHRDGEDPAQTMMMQFYMLGAMEYFDTINDNRLQMIAMEIAMTGVNGISPEKKYSIPAIPNKEFGGWEFLAYYYVSWARCYPQKLDALGLPFNTAYEGALTMYNMKKGGK